MKQVLIRKGEIVVEDVPVPLVERRGVLVRVSYSCISIGTEMAGMRASGRPLWKRALSQPDRVIRTLQMALSDGISRTHNLVQNQLAGAIPVGYSAAGEVIGVGAEVDDLIIGDRVACSGAQSAFHAEVISVPRNLVAPIPNDLDYPAASTVTLGAIALQGLRRANPTLGETFVVVGLGALGQMTVQLLAANGCRTIGIDVASDRVEIAKQSGLDVGFTSVSDQHIQDVMRLSGGKGVDGVIVTAASSSNAIISQAFRMCRRKGRVVLVGDVGLDIDRNDVYLKELDFFVSTSYGPGRYDARYEELGLDYPIGYVRWTENRNMEEYLRLLGRGQIDVSRLVGLISGITEVPEAYRSICEGRESPLLALIEYPYETPVPQFEYVPSTLLPAGSGAIGIAVIGVGNYARGMHLPLLKDMSETYHLKAVVGRTGFKVKEVADQFGVENASTNYGEVLADPAVEAVLLATRHDQHARQVCAAIRAGKHVLVEKPLAVGQEGLEAIVDVLTKNTDIVLLTGFNRNFSPIIERVLEITNNRKTPMTINYRMNAGYIPADHWVHGDEGGGRNIGEACHIYALFTLLTGSKVSSISATAINCPMGYYGLNDNFVATLGFEDGSVASLTYTAQGHADMGKERMELHVDGISIVLDDYRSLQIFGRDDGMRLKLPDKGQRAQLEAFAQVLRNGGEWPIPLWQQLQAMRIAYEVELDIHRSLHTTEE